MARDLQGPGSPTFEVRVHPPVCGQPTTVGPSVKSPVPQHERGLIMTAIGRGGVRNPWTQPTYGYYNTRFEQSLTEQDTAGKLTMMRMTLNPESAPPLHFHTREDEFWTVVSGRVRFWLGGSTLASCAVQEADPGGFVFGPRNVPHTFQTITEAAEVLIGNTPGALEGISPGSARQMPATTTRTPTSWRTTACSSSARHRCGANGTADTGATFRWSAGTTGSRSASSACGRVTSSGRWRRRVGRHRRTTLRR